ncbi:MAG: hypothetical protein MUF51_03805 [Vicinamibacteria bacterium]|nr:hypothetical protein [Vicinamibacteria bacterium]
MSTILSCLSSFVIGCVLIVGPWTIWWEANYLLPQSLWLRAVALSAVTRGAVTGLGLINILAAIIEVYERFFEPRD